MDAGSAPRASDRPRPSSPAARTWKTAARRPVPPASLRAPGQHPALGGRAQIARLMRGMTLVVALVALDAQPSRAQCAGDCDRDSAVTVDELVTLVGIHRGALPDTACAVDNSSPVAVADILAAASRALGGPSLLHLANGPTTPEEFFAAGGWACGPSGAAPPAFFTFHLDGTFAGDFPICRALRATTWEETPCGSLRLASELPCGLLLEGVRGSDGGGLSFTLRGTGAASNVPPLPYACRRCAAGENRFDCALSVRTPTPVPSDCSRCSRIYLYSSFGQFLRTEESCAPIACAEALCEYPCPNEACSAVYDISYNTFGQKISEREDTCAGTPGPTASRTATQPTATVTRTPSATQTPTDTPPSPTFTVPAPSRTASPTATRTASGTATRTRTPTPPPCAADCDGDRFVNLAELVICEAAATGGFGMPVASVCRGCDLDSDGTVSLDEFSAHIAAFVEGCPGGPPPATPQPAAMPGPCAGDCNANGEVEPWEVQVCSALARQVGSMPCPACDLDGSGFVSDSDVAAQIANLRNGCPPLPTATEEPTPSPTELPPDSPTPEPTATVTATATATATFAPGKRILSLGAGSSYTIVGPATFTSSSAEGFLELTAQSLDARAGARVDVTDASAYLSFGLIAPVSGALCLRVERDSLPLIGAGMLDCSEFGRSDIGFDTSRVHTLGVVGNGGFTADDCAAANGTLDSTPEHSGVCNGPLRLHCSFNDGPKGALRLAPSPCNNAWATTGLPVYRSVEDALPCGDEQRAEIPFLLRLTTTVSFGAVFEKTNDLVPALETSARGESFSCSAWSVENGPGRLVFVNPVPDLVQAFGPAMHGIEVFVLDD